MNSLLFYFLPPEEKVNCTRINTSGFTTDISGLRLRVAKEKAKKQANKQKLGILLLIEKSIASMCLEADEKRKP